MNIAKYLLGILLFAALCFFSSCDLIFGGMSGQGFFPTYYSISYNGASADSGIVPPAKSYLAGTELEISANTGNLTRAGYTFSHWSTAVNGLSGKYYVGQHITLNQNLILYAQWEAGSIPEYTLRYDANGVSEGTVPSSVTKPRNTYIDVSDNSGNLRQDGYLFSGWNTQADGTGVDYDENDQIFLINDITLYAQWNLGKTFWAQKATSDGSYYEIDAELLAVGAHSLVYADNNLSFSKVNAESIMYEFESNIYPKITGTFGTFEDIDENGKVTILLLDIIDGYSSTSGGGYVAGYFAPGDMESKISNSRSNEADMIYIDVNPGWNEGKMLYTTLAHELQHGINYSRKITGKPDMDLWINEGLSSAAEYVYGGYQDSRLADYNNDYYTSITQGNNFYVWNGYWEEEGDMLANYSTVYLFFQWLRVHASNDTGIYKDIIASSYANYNAVTGSAGSRISSQFSNWDTLLSTWMWANIKNDVSGYEGYNNNAKLKPVWYPINVLQSPPNGVQLASGEGVFSLKIDSGTFNPSDTTYVKYSNEMCYPSFFEYLDEPPSSEYDSYLTVNVNPNIEGNDQSGQIAAAIKNDFSQNVLASRLNNARTAAPSRTYPISFADKQHELKAKENQGGKTKDAGFADKR
jgi:uncharacterized repeat protein (TIGR02543 family)